MIYFESPVFLLLLIPLLLFLMLRPFALRSVNMLQGVIFLLLVCALSGMKLRFPAKEGILFILCDKSLSMPAGAEKSMEKQIRIISRRMKNSPGVISFAGHSLVEHTPGNGVFTGFKSGLSNRHSSDINGAVSTALKLIPRDTPGRLLLISDGKWNGKSPETSFSAALMRGIKIDWLPLRRENFNDFAITGISAPLSCSPGEYAAMICRVYAPRGASVKCGLRKNNGPRIEREIRLREGENRIIWRDRNDAAGICRYDFSIVPPPGDEVKENNAARHLLEVKGPEKILLLTNSPSGNLGKLLENGKLDVEIVKVPSERVSPETLGRYRAVILENIPASSLTPDANALIAELVKSGRMGLLMTGGPLSLAAGGWYKTPIGEILPVSMEKQHELRRRKSALMLALDRSGSMGAAVDGVTKMIMANTAAVESCKLLSPQDEFGVIAVDSSVHQVVPLQKKGENDHAGTIMSIEAMGGGIFVDRALHESVRQLLRSDAPVRHLLLFADAADAEQPGDYRELLTRAVKAGITVSVVGLGKADSSDSDLLREIARLGKGKCYFVENASELVRVFAEDTFVMVRASFSREKIICRPTADLAVFSGIGNISQPFEANGYNLCFAKPRSRVLLRADDGENVPVAVTGYAGLGRTALLGIEVDGEYTGKFAKHPRGGALIAALTRYVMMPRKSAFKDCLIVQNMDSGIFKSEILLDPERRKIPFSGTPVLSLLVTDGRGKVTAYRHKFRWQGPDRLSAEKLIPPGATVNAAVVFDSGEILPLAPVLQNISPEFVHEASEDITGLVHLTGGRIKSSFDNIGASLERQWLWISCTPLLLILAIGLLLLQVWMRRSGREFPRFKWSLHRRSFSFERIPKKSSPRKKEEAQKETPAPPDEKQEPPEPEEDLSAALKRAKRR